jgi:hypothetical protein
MFRVVGGASAKRTLHTNSYVPQISVKNVLMRSFQEVYSPLRVLYYNLLVCFLRMVINDESTELDGLLVMIVIWALNCLIGVHPEEKKATVRI